MHFVSLKELDPSEGTVQLHNTSKDDRLIFHPTPNPNDPNDPLRWPRWKKHVCFASVCAFTFLTNYGIGGMAPAFFILSKQFNKTQTEISTLLSYPILVLGVFNFFWVPMANYFGKRPVFVFASLVLCMSYLWGALAKSFDSLFWSHIIAAFAGSSTEALGASIVSDLYYLHERGNLMGIYANSISGGNTVGPLICGFVVTGLSWRWHKWISFILVGINFIVIVLFCPETRYDRSGISSTVTTATNSTESLDPAEFNANCEKTLSPGPEETHGVDIPKKAWTQQLGLWSGVPPNTNLLKLFIRPFPMIAYPAVIFAFLGYAVSVAWISAVNILNAFVLQAPPYSWKADINGLINIPGLIGNVVGSFLGGWLVDRYADWRSKKNDGIFQPETRLHLLFIPGLVVPAGCLLFGYGVDRFLHWTTL